MSRQQPLTAAEFKDIYSKVPRLCVDILLTVDHQPGVVLLLRQHSSWKNMWHFPGGTVFYREPLKQAVVRVLAEEVGISARIIKSLEPVEFHTEVEQRGFGYSVAIPFVCHTSEGLSEKNQEGETIRIFTEVPDNMVAEQKAVMQQGLRTMG